MSELHNTSRESAKPATPSLPSTPPPCPAASAAPLLAGDTQPLLPGADLSPSRRAFLGWAGFGVASTALAGCSRGPVKHVVPYLTAPPELVPGRAYWVATACDGCSAGCGVLARCRDGRPVKLEGNPEHPLSRGGLCAAGQASVLGLYDSKRLKTPQLEGAPSDWDTADAELRALLDQVRNQGGRVRLLTGTVTSPSTRAAIARFVASQPDARHVEYDALSASALLDAQERAYGVRALPAYRFDRARVIVSFDADFLGTWISPVSFAADYAAGRRPDAAGQSSRHIQLEARTSLTGGGADQRHNLAPWETAPLLAHLCRELEEHHSVATQLAPPGGARGSEATTLRELAASLAAELWSARGAALVVAGANDLVVQLLVAYANALLEGAGNTLTLARPGLALRGDDRALAELGRELDAGAVDLLVVSGANPAYDLPRGFSESLARAGTLVAHSDGQDETAALASWVLPPPHGLEAWGDAEPVLGRVTLAQPTIPPLRDARTLRRVLAAWTGDERTDDALLRDHWQGELEGRLPAGTSFESHFDRALHDGFLPSDSGAADAEPAFRPAAVAGLGRATAVAPAGSEAGLGLVLYAEIGVGDGRHALNPWLQELPDPVTKVVWDNTVSLSPARAGALGVESGDLVRIVLEDGLEATDAEVLELPVLVQPGQHDAVAAVALGYGRRGTERFAGVGPDWLEARPTLQPGERVGANAAQLLVLRDESLRGDVRSVRIEPTGRRTQLARTQDHHSLEVPAHLAIAGHETRDAVRTTTLAEYTADPAHALGHGSHPEAELWPDDHDYTNGHHWGMVVDLNACTGCSACVVGCQAENNVPVVGKDEVARHRELHWLRIDRYLGGSGGDTDAAHQPMFCQQCDNAPCESVCPVLATVHSSEGLNQQVYNRCVGTRYCANTCPYKVRRFNWFDYPREDELTNQVLNPDVTVRTRGVMEKCSFCAQRIQDAKNEAAREGRALRDGDIQSACMQSCPTQAIVFGDLSDPESRVSHLAASPRAYTVLAELNVKPSVRYLARVRNREPESSAHASGQAHDAAEQPEFQLPNASHGESQHEG